MLHSMSFSSTGRVLAIVTMLFMAIGWAVAPSSSAAFETTPEPIKPTVTLISITEVPREDSEAQTYEMYMARIDFPTVSSTLHQEIKSVSFTVAVTAGSICYTVSLPTGSTATATFASPGDATATHAGCTGAETDLICETDLNGRHACELNDGDTVYLPNNSAVEQKLDSTITITNPDAAVQTQVVIAGIDVGDGAGCGGVCP